MGSGATAGTLPNVPGYEILEPIGYGGFATVYRARHLMLGRQVAIKILNVDVPDEFQRRSFLRECQAAGAISAHPNIVTIHDAGILGGTTRGGQPFLVLELCPGGSLAQQLTRDGPLPVGIVIDVGLAMCAALGAAHQAAVLHRDIKPANILWKGDGVPALADFGIARLVDRATTGTMHSLTPDHAAPETLRGSTPTIAADVYSLASTLFELLTGAPPFAMRPDEGIWQLLHRVLDEAPPPLRRADVPPRVGVVLQRAMAKDPAQRYQTTDVFGHALRWAST